MKYVFDLKGSIVGRFVKNSLNKKATLKDLNFLQITSKKHVNYINIIFI